MKLQQYFKMWNSINEDESDMNINEFVDLNTKLKIKSEHEKIFLGTTRSVSYKSIEVI